MSFQLLEDSHLTHSLSGTHMPLHLLTLPWLLDLALSMIQAVLKGKNPLLPPSWSYLNTMPNSSPSCPHVIWHLWLFGGWLLTGVQVMHAWIFWLILCSFVNWLLLWSSRIPGCYLASEEGAQRRNRKLAGISLWFYRSGLLILTFLVCPFKYSSRVRRI